MSRFLFLSIFLAIQIIIKAQSIAPSVIASAGNFFSNVSYSFDYTIGEMALIDSKQNPQVIITQGFHQPENSTVFVNEAIGDSIFFSVYPNPDSEFIQIQFLLEMQMNASIRIYYVTSRIIFIEEKYVENEERVKIKMC